MIDSVQKAVEELDCIEDKKNFLHNFNKCLSNHMDEDEFIKMFMELCVQYGHMFGSLEKEE